jgi:4-hydroxybenzoate polyprenyltransferase
MLALQAGGGRKIQALLSVKVALLSAIAGSIAVASCVLNDFFDYSVDIINEPSKVRQSSVHRPS